MGLHWWFVLWASIGGPFYGPPLVVRTMNPHPDATRRRRYRRDRTYHASVTCTGFVRQTPPFGPDATRRRRYRRDRTCHAPQALPPGPYLPRVGHLHWFCAADAAIRTRTPTGGPIDPFTPRGGIVPQLFFCGIQLIIPTYPDEPFMLPPPSTMEISPLPPPLSRKNIRDANSKILN